MFHPIYSLFELLLGLAPRRCPALAALLVSAPRAQRTGLSFSLQTKLDLKNLPTETLKQSKSPDAINAMLSYFMKKLNQG